MRLADVNFDESDRNLFQVDDPRLRADALKHSILPRLHIVLNECISLIRQIYGVEAFDDSSVSFFPHFRMKRERELKLLYQHAFVGLAGKRSEGKWHGLVRKDHKPVQFLPFRFGLLLSENGLECFLQNGWCMRGITDASYEKLLRFHLDFEEVTHSLCYSSRMVPHLFYGADLEPISTFREHYEWMIKNRCFDNSFLSQRPRGYPISTESLQSVVEEYVLFYCIYDSYLQICKGYPIRLSELLAKANVWLRAVYAEEREAKEERTEPSPQVVTLAVRQSAEQKVKVMPAMRWQVFQRDDWKCVSCGRGSAQDAILHVDHITPRSKGGSDRIENYQSLCDLCNLGKSNRDNTNLRLRKKRDGY